MNLKTILEVFSQTGANSRVLATDGEDMVNHDHACFFLKDAEIHPLSHKS